MTAHGDIRTPDQRLRVFVSSTLGELAPERAAVRAAIEDLHLTPVMFELGARPHPPRELYRAYLGQSDLFLGLYWERYGHVAPGMAVSGLEDEYDQIRHQPRLLYVKEPAPDRDAQLRGLLERIERDGAGCYRVFAGAAELADLVREDLAHVLSEHFYAAAGGIAAKSADHTPVRGPLPTFAASFIGRAREMQELCGLVTRGDVRLVTLTGPGGIGKTRLAAACAQSLQSEFRGGVAFVSLAHTSDPTLVLPTIAAGVGAAEEQRRPPLEVLAMHVGDEPTLLVLDNFEQVVPAAPQLAELLAVVPSLTLMVTSRALLRVRGEHEFPVPALEVPPTDLDLIAQLSATPAVKLFVDRARMARHDFELTADNALAVAEICRRLEGLPLAIEVAAARTRLLPPPALLALLTSRLDALGRGPSDLPDRQRTLRATIEWSYGLLDKESARALTMLAVFAGGWTLEAAVSVCERDEPAMLELLDTLAGHSLVTANGFGDEPRFAMLETVREYAVDLLSPDVASAAAARHAAYYCGLVDRAAPYLRGDGQAVWAAKLDADHGNLRQATRWLLDNRDGSSASDLLWGAVLSWWLKGHLVEVRAWLCEANGLSEELDSVTQARLLVTTALVALELGEDAEVRASTERALTLLASADEPLLEAVARLFLGYTLPSFGEFDAAQRSISVALGAFRHLDEPFFTGLATTSLGGFFCVAGDLSAARSHHEEAIGTARRIHNDRLLAQCITELAVVAIEEGEPDEARALLGESGSLFLDAESIEGLALTLVAYARLALLEDDPRRAATAIGASQAARERIGIVGWPSYREIEQQLVRTIRQAVGDAAYEAAWQAGRAMRLPEMLVAAQRPAGRAAPLVRCTTLEQA